MQTAELVEQLRAFNRFYTQRIGVLDAYLESDLSLAQVRVLYELAHVRHETDASGLTARELSTQLGIDEGYMSRMLRDFVQRQWITRSAHPQDARQQLLQLTAEGLKAFKPLERKSQQAMQGLIAHLDTAERQQLHHHMQQTQALLQAKAQTHQPMRLVELRSLKAGDMGWVVQAHGEVYAQEYNWDIAFEGMVAQIAAQFIQHYKPQRERAWIAQINGQRVGCVFVVERSKTVAQLRMLLLTPQARGLGLGLRLVEEVIAFSKAQGYKKIMLLTYASLTAAVSIYRKCGFELKYEESTHEFGHNLNSQTWELKL